MAAKKKPTEFDVLWGKSKPVKDLGGHMKIKALLQGASGSRKTTTASLFKRPLIIPTEMQAIPVIRHANPDAIIFHNSSGRPGLIDSDDLQEVRKLLRDPDLPNRVDAVVLDSLTDCQRIIKDTYTKAQTSGRSTTDQDTWGSVIDMTARLAREVRDLEVHVIVTVLDQELESGHHRPSVFGKKLPNDLAQYFNLVGFQHSMEMPSGEIRHQTLFRFGGDKYLVKGLPQLDDVEPPEPLYWAAKCFGGDDDISEVMDRVRAWRALADPSTGKEVKKDENPFS